MKRIYGSFTGLLKYLLRQEFSAHLGLKDVAGCQDVLFAFGCSRLHVFGSGIDPNAKFGNITPMSEWCDLLQDVYRYDQQNTLEFCENFRNALREAEQQGRVFWIREMAPCSDYTLGGDEVPFEQSRWGHLDAFLRRNGIEVAREDWLLARANYGDTPSVMAVVPEEGDVAVCI